MSSKQQETWVFCKTSPIYFFSLIINFVPLLIKVKLLIQEQNECANAKLLSMYLWICVCVYVWQRACEIPQYCYNRKFKNVFTYILDIRVKLRSLKSTFLSALGFCTSITKRAELMHTVNMMHTVSMTYVLSHSHCCEFWLAV